MEQETFLMHPEVKQLLEDLVRAMKIEVRELTIQPGSLKGDNYLGVIAKVLVNGKKNNADVKLHWIAKSASQVDSFRQYTNIEKAYEREIYMYKEVFPIYMKLQTEASIGAPFKAIAPFIGSCLKQYQEVVIMEDMKQKGFVLRNRMEGLDFEHVKLVMETYGKLHAMSYAVEHQTPDLFESIKENTEENFISRMDLELLQKQEEGSCEKSVNALDTLKHSVHMAKFSKYKKRSVTVLVDSFRKSYRDPYSVVGHGDSWVNNMLFKYDDDANPQKPTEVCLLDFQLSRYGSPAFDLSYFIFTCTEKELRDEHFDEMINIYYRSLCTHLTRLGSVAETILPFRVLLDQLKRYSIVGFFFTQMVLYLMISEPDEIPDLTKEMDSDEMLSAFSYKSKNEGFYSRRIRGILEDFVEKGYFDFIGDEYED